MSFEAKGGNVGRPTVVAGDGNAVRHNNVFGARLLVKKTFLLV